MSPRSFAAVLAGSIGFFLAATRTSDALSGSTAVDGSVRLHELTSRVFQNTRTLRVLVPDGYDDPGNRRRRYPVLYLNDGQKLFEPTGWHLGETVRRLVTDGEIPPLIVVGIDNAGPRLRFREYFPYFDSYLQPPEPAKGSLYPSFLADEVLPFVNARYRTLADAENTGIGGASAGGLASIYAAFKRPNTFGRLLIESPSVYVDDYHVLREAEHYRAWPRRVYVGVGTNENNAPNCLPDDSVAPELIRDVRRFEQLLLASGLDSSEILVVVVPCAEHNEAAWAARLPNALRFLYGGTSPRRMVRGEGEVQGRGRGFTKPGRSW